MLCLGTNNQLGRIVDRTRIVSSQLRSLAQTDESCPFYQHQLQVLGVRWTLVLRALKLFYTSLGSFAGRCADFTFGCRPYYFRFSCGVHRRRSFGVVIRHYGRCWFGNRVRDNGERNSPGSRKSCKRSNFSRSTRWRRKIAKYRDIRCPGFELRTFACRFSVHDLARCDFLGRLCTLKSPVRNAGLRNKKWLHLRYPARLMRARKFSRLSLHRKSIGFALRATSGTSTAAKFFSIKSPVRNAGLKEQKMAAPPIPSALDPRTQIFPTLTPAQINRIRPSAKCGRSRPAIFC